VGWARREEVEGGGRAAEEVALGMLGADRGQDFALLLGLDTLDDDVHPEPVTQTGERLHDPLALRVAAQSAVKLRSTLIPETGRSRRYDRAEKPVPKSSTTIRTPRLSRCSISRRALGAALSITDSVSSITSRSAGSPVSASAFSTESASPGLVTWFGETLIAT